MPHVGVIFEVQKVETRPGETVGVVGSRPELSNWNPYGQSEGSLLQLVTGASTYPRWLMPAPVWVKFEDAGEQTPSSTPSTTTEEEDAERAGESEAHASGDTSASAGVIVLEYKYVKDRRQLTDRGPSIQWEDNIANRRLEVPREPGSIWIVCDPGFNDCGRPTTVSRASLVEVLERRQLLDPEWTIHRRQSLDPEWTNHRDELSGDEAPEWSGRESENVSTPGSIISRSSASHNTTSTIGLFNLGGQTKAS